MATALKENLPPQTESRSAKKKKTKAAVSTPASAPSQTAEESKEEHVNGDTGSESAYLKEISKNIRNIKKKIAATAKVELIVAENEGKTVEELLASRTINADQKAQYEKKPGLVAQLESYESQYEQYKKLDDEYQTKLGSEKASLLASHSEELEKVKADIRAEVEEEHKTLFTSKLLTLSRFLRTAAAKRSDEENEAEDNQAFEGTLLLVYGGDLSAVRAIEKLIDGADEKVPGVDGQDTGFTFKHVRDASKSVSATADQPSESITETEPSSELHKGAEENGSDPTIVHAGLTELDDNAIVANGVSPVTEPSLVPDASTTNAEAANEAAEAHWDQKLSQSVTSGPDGFEIIEHPRDPKETETGLTATPAAPTGTQSWAEDVPTEAPVITSATPAEDGFHEVSHHRTGGRGRGGGGQYEHRGRGGFRGRGGDGRGRGSYRGRGEGRGRGGPRGGTRGRGESAPQAVPTQ